MGNEKPEATSSPRAAARMKRLYRSLGAALGLAALLVLAVLSLAAPPAWASHRNLIADAFGKGEFVPHYYRDVDWVHDYGPGTVEVEDESRQRLYTSRDGLWLRTAGDASIGREYQIVEEILVTSLPLGNGKSIGQALGSVELLGIGLGSGEGALLDVYDHRPGRSLGRATLGGLEVTEYAFFPSEDTNTMYKFYVSEDKVVGISIAVTE